MDHLILLANIGSDLAKMGQQTAETFGVDWPHLIAQIISFSIVAILLARFAYKAELAKTEAARLEVLEQANLQANNLIEQARAAAARVQEQETQKAIAAAKEIVEKAKQAAEAEHARMLIELKREVGKLVVQTTGKVTGKILTSEDQRRLAEETTRQLAA